MSKHKEKIKLSNILIIVIIIAAAIILAYALTAMSRTSAPKIYATVNGEKITDQYLDEVKITVPSELKQNLTLKMLVEQAINLEIVRQEAVKMGLSVSDKEVDDSVSNVLTSLGMEKSDFITALKKQGITEETLREAFRKQLLAVKYVNITILSKTIVTEKEVNDTYNMYSAQINASYDSVKNDLENALKVQKGQLVLENILQQKRQEYNITRTTA
jgi:parvulin-like peptidyl-prolyl isomerase